MAGCSGDGGGDGDGGGGGGGSGGSETVKIGLVTATEGALAFAGEIMIRATETAIEEANQRDDYLPNTELEFVVQNSGGAPESALSAAREVILQENVDLLAGGILSSVGGALSGFADEEGIPYLPLNPSDAAITGRNCTRSVFRAYAHAEQRARGVVDYGSENLGDSTYLVIPDYSFGHSVEEASVPLLEERGVEILDTARLPQGNEEWGSVIDDIKTQDPDYVQMEMLVGGLSSFLSQAVNRDFDYPMIGQSVTPNVVTGLTPGQFEQLPRLIYGAMRYHIESEAERNESFIETHQELHDEEPGEITGTAYANLNLLTETLDEMDSYSADGFIDTAEGLEIDTIIGQTTVRECDHQGTPNIFVGEVSDIGGENEAPTYELLETIDTEPLTPPCSETECQF